MELALERAYSHVPAIGGFIAAIEIGASVEKIAGALPLPKAHLNPARHLGQQNRNTVDHRHVENLALARALPLDQRSEHPHGEECAAAAKVTDQIERRRRRRVTRPDRIEGAGEREIVDVMSCARSQRAGLPPPAHARINQTRIGFAEYFGTESEPFHRARSIPFDKNVCLHRQIANEIVSVGRFQIDRHRGAVAIKKVELRIAAKRAPGAEAFNAQDVGAQIGEQHGAKRRRAKPGKFQNPNTGSRRHRAIFFFYHRLVIRLPWRARRPYSHQLKNILASIRFSCHYLIHQTGADRTIRGERDHV